MMSLFTDQLRDLNIGDKDKAKTVAVKETQAINLKKATASAILMEYAIYLKERGDDKNAIFKEIENQALETVESLYLPKKYAPILLRKVTTTIFSNEDRKARLRQTLIGNIVEINKEDQGGDDAGLGLPEGMRATCDKITEYDKVIDESGDLIVEAQGNKFIETCLGEMKKHLPESFVKMIS